MLHGTLWIECSGTAWLDLSEHLGPWSTVYQRFRDWRNDGTCNSGLFRRRKKGPEEPLDHALGRSRGGLTTKIHIVCNANDVLLRFLLSPAQASDITHAQPLLDQVRIPGKQGDHASVVVGYWMTKTMTQNTCVITATGTECSR